MKGTLPQYLLAPSFFIFRKSRLPVFSTPVIDLPAVSNGDKGISEKVIGLIIVARP